MGIEVVEFLTSDLPDRADLTIDLRGDSPEIVINGRRLRWSDIGVFWNRRLERPQAPEWIHEDDRDVLERECFELANNARHLLSALVPTINPASNQNRADRKALQLHTAKTVGLNVKPTLIGNAFNLIQEFRAGSLTIHKPFRFHQWRDSEDLKGNFTAPTPELTEDMRQSVESCPMIFQGHVEGHRDVRIICFGDVQTACCFTKLRESPSGTIDGRQLLREGAVSGLSIEVPDALSRALHEYMDRLGLFYAAFDFMIDEDEKWWFLECNESGQFLFIEYFVPESRLLDRFCCYLAELAGAHGEKGGGDISIAAFEAEGGLDDILAHHSVHKTSKQNIWAPPKTPA